jgi:hypothetical protein
MSKVWYGFREILAMGFTFPRADTVSAEFSMDLVAVHNGDTIVHTLFGWYAESAIEGDASGLQAMMSPGFVALTYSPDPDGDVEGSAQAPGGAMLIRETLAWQQRLYTNGTDYGVKYWAGSGYMRENKTSRTIHDKTNASLFLTASIRRPNNPFPVEMLATDVNIMLWAEALILHK